jgi:hypothetical protein
MDLPNYFLADLPDASTLSAQLITDACHTLKQNRARYLAPLSTDEIITILSKLCREWLEPSFHYRQLLLDTAPSRTGFSLKTISAGLDNFFAQVTGDNLAALLAQDLGSARRLDDFLSTDTERKQNRSSLARGPELLVHFTGGVLPNPVFSHILFGLLLRSAQFVKCATGTTYMPRIFAHSLYAAHPKLGACLEIAEWRGGAELLETALFAETNILTATGSDESLSEIRRALPSHVRFVGYGHQVSFAYVTREALSKPEKTVAALATDIVAWNQLGCLSPHAVYVEAGGAIPADQLAGLLATELDAREKSEPRGEVPPAVAGSIATRRVAYEIRASADPSTQLWRSDNSTAWTVVHETDPSFQPSCLHRFVHVRPIEHIDALLAILEPLRGKISTVGVASPVDRIQEIASRLASLGVTRICRAGQMQNPPLSWRHDGRPALADLVTWTDIEF